MVVLGLGAEQHPGPQRVLQRHARPRLNNRSRVERGAAFHRARTKRGHLNPRLRRPAHGELEIQPLEVIHSGVLEFLAAEANGQLGIQQVGYLGAHASECGIPFRPTGHDWIGFVLQRVVRRSGQNLKVLRNFVVEGAAGRDLADIPAGQVVRLPVDGVVGVIPFVVADPAPRFDPRAGAGNRQGAVLLKVLDRFVSEDIVAERPSSLDPARDREGWRDGDSVRQVQSACHERRGLIGVLFSQVEVPDDFRREADPPIMAREVRIHRK